MSASERELLSEIETLKEAIKKLTGRCILLTDGAMCMFCDIQCEFRTENFAGKGERI